MGKFFDGQPDHNVFIGLSKDTATNLAHDVYDLRSRVVKEDDLDCIVTHDHDVNRINFVVKLTKVTEAYYG